MALGHFSLDLKRMSIVKGSVFRMTLYPSEGVVPKHKSDISRDKYFVVLGIEGDNLLVGSLLINTQININLIEIIAPYQYLLTCESYEFLNQNLDMWIAMRSKKSRGIESHLKPTISVCCKTKILRIL